MESTKRKITKFQFIAKRIGPLAIVFGFILIIYGYRDKLFTFDLPKENSPYIVMGLLYIVAGIAFFLYRYIELGPAKKYSSFYTHDYFERKLSKELDKIRLEFSSKLVSTEHKGIDSNQLDELIQDKIKFNLEHVLKDFIENKYSENAIKSRQQKILDSQTNELQIGVNN